MSRTFTANPTKDGIAICTTAGTFIDIHGANGTNANSTNTTIVPTIATGNKVFTEIDRAKVTFDTSTIGSSAVLNSATISITKTGSVQTGLGTTDICITPAGGVGTSVAASDYQGYVYSRLGSSPWTAFANGTPVVISISDLAYINATGYTILGILLGWDADISQPTLTNFTATSMAFISTEGGTGKPLLTVLYQIPTDLSLTSGNSQTGYLGEALTDSLVVQVTDSNDNSGVDGVTVSFAITAYPTGATGQSITHSSVSTTGGGFASVSLTIGDKLGTYTVQASVAGLTGSPVTFTASGIARPSSSPHVLSTRDSAHTISSRESDYTLSERTDSHIVEERQNTHYVRMQ